MEINNPYNNNDYTLTDSITLNGEVGYVKSYDEAEEIIGVKNITQQVKFSGETLLYEGLGFPFSKEMEDRIDWCGSYASVRFVTCDAPIDPTKIEENLIKSYYGNVEQQYYHRYSDYTGYLWTEEEFVIGGHDLIKILTNNIGKYIHMEIELYKKK